MTLLDIETQVDRVFVFRNGALVTRVGQVELAGRDGRREVRVDLPLSAEPDSVRVRLADAGSWRAVAVEAVSSSPTREEPSERNDGGVFGPAARFANPHRVEQLRSRLEWLNRHRERFESISVVGSTGERDDSATRPVGGREHRTGIDTIESEVAAARLRSRVIVRIEEQRAACEQLLAELTADDTDAVEGASYAIALEGDDDAVARIEVDYFVPGPTWFPSYSLRLTEPTTSGALTMQAFVAQDTGEDWDGVGLTLSTARYDVESQDELDAARVDGPWRDLGTHRLFAGFDMHYEASDPHASESDDGQDSERRSVPPLVYGDGSTAGVAGGPARLPHPEWLDYRRLALRPASDPARGALHLPSDEGALDAREAARERSLQVSRNAPPPRHDRPRSRDGFDFTFEAARRAEVPSTGRPVCCVVEERHMETTLRYVAVPRESSVAFRRVELQNDGDKVLLKGPVDVYVDGVYLLTTSLDHTTVGDVASLYIGTEPRLHVTREERVEETSSGLLRGAKELRHHVDVHVRNETDAAITIDVRARVPVAKQDGVRVTVEHVEPPWRRLDPNRPDRPGRYRWRERIEAHESCVLSVSYAMRVPARQTIVRTSRGSRA